jgi:outer membrane protein
MKIAKILAGLAAPLVLGTLPGPSFAQENTVRLGAYFVSYAPSAADLSGPYTPPGLNLDVKKLTTPYAAYLRELSPHWVFELAAGVPPKTEAVGKGPATVGSVPFNGELVATVKWFSPTAFIEYKFLDASSPIRPYLGLGVNYTKFFDRQITSSGMAIVGGPTSVSMSDSVGPAATAGAEYHFPGGFHVMASYSAARIRTNFAANTSGIVRSTSIDFRPTTIVVGVGYSFKDPW